MKLNTIHALRIAAIIVIALLSASCDDFDSYSDSSEHTLSFSEEALDLDTILTGTSTPTYTIKVYNRNDKSIVVSSVELASHGASGFRINVDGESGYSFNNIELRHFDSIYIFVEATLKERNSDTPVLNEDSIVFMTNGVRQHIKLSAYGQDCFIMRHKTIEHDTIINANRPIVIYDSLVIAEGTRLSIAAGSKLLFHDKAGLTVHGSVTAEGTIDRPIVMRGDRMDYMLSDIPYDRLPGQWGGVMLSSESYDNIMSHVDIHGGTYGILCEQSEDDMQKLTLTNSKIQQVNDDGVSINKCRVTIGNSLIANAGGNCIGINGGVCDLIHCTIANFYSWKIRNGVALHIVDSDSKAYVTVGNCIISGTLTNEISVISDEGISFSNCMIKDNRDIEGTNYVNVVRQKEDNFRLTDHATEQYDFRLSNKSEAINLGDKGIAAPYPFDLNGLSRFEDDAPDAGCYEFEGENDK